MHNPDSSPHKTLAPKKSKKHSKSAASKKIDKHGLFKYQQQNTLPSSDNINEASLIDKDKLTLLQFKYWQDSMANSEYLESLSENARMLPADNNEFAEWMAAIEERKSNLKRS